VTVIVRAYYYNDNFRYFVWNIFLGSRGYHLVLVFDKLLVNFAKPLCTLCFLALDEAFVTKVELVFIQ